jgi:lactoylglutathione lyase
MKLAHIALWTRDLDAASTFWREYFDAEIGELYESRRQCGFQSRFATLPGGVQIELMVAPWVKDPAGGEAVGWAHIALSLDGAAAVDAAAARFEASGLLVSPPRTTGDGFYEAIVRTPDGTAIEITA